MSKKPLSAALALILLVIVTTLWIGAPVPLRAEERGNDGAVAVQKLTDRVAALEVAVIRDPHRPKDTVLARLDAVEERLKDFGKTGAVDAKADQKSFEELRKAMERMERQNQELDRKLKALEQERQGGDDGAVAKAVKDVKREVDGLERALDDLKARVTKLEVKR